MATFNQPDVLATVAKELGVDLPGGVKEEFYKPLDGLHERVVRTKWGAHPTGRSRQSPSPLK